VPTLKFPPPFRHDHPPVVDVEEQFDKQLTFGQRAADSLAAVVGSWRFMVSQTVLLMVWALLNVAAWNAHWDPYPFILMNLVLSLQAAYAAPIIMMSQNRQDARDRLDVRNDYLINSKAEVEIRAILEHLAAQDRALATLHEMIERHHTTSAETRPNPGGTP
jgi:uncharacterized membrane protein